MNFIQLLKLKINNWIMERIPEIERPACPQCKQPMYWHRSWQDWACKPCDDCHFDMHGAYDDTDDYGYGEDEYYDDYEDEYNPDDDYEDDEEYSQEII